MTCTLHLITHLKMWINPSTAPTFTKASSGHALNPTCACNPFSSQVRQDKFSNYMFSPCPSSAENLLKESAVDTGEEDYPVNWLTFISSMSSKTVITGSSITEPTPDHVTYSTLASMNHQWTINLPHFRLQPLK